MAQKNSIKAIGLLILLGVIWGSGYSIARYATTHGVSPLGYSFWQSVGPAVFLLLVSMAKRELKISAHTLRYVVIAGVLGDCEYRADYHVSLGIAGAARKI